jgi:septum formation protein
MSDATNQIVLASASPRRAHLLQGLGISFEVDPSQVVERPHANEPPTDYIIRVARAKAVEVARKRQSGLIIGADTEVVASGKILGKPADDQDARRMLKMLSGGWHAVFTAIALYDAGTRREAADYEKTLVRFGQLSDAEIDWYIHSGEPFDKAGGYAIQGLGSVFITEIAGTYHNVVGLPLPLLYRLAKQVGRPLFHI